MPDFSDTLMVGITSRTLFDLEEEDKLFKEKGVVEYRKAQKEKEDLQLNPGTTFHLVKALLNLNKLSSLAFPLVMIEARKSRAAS